MEVAEPPSTALPSGQAYVTALRPAPRTTSPRKVQPTPIIAAKDARVKRTSPRSGPGGLGGREHGPSTKPTAKGARMPSIQAKPLLPVTERRPNGDKTSPRTSKESEADKWDIAPDGGSAGREGRQFAVANVGNNGRIYLRPTVRPAHQRYPQPNFVFPITPPGTAGLETISHDQSKLDDGSELHTSLWTPTPLASPLSPDQYYFSDVLARDRPTLHRRAVSDSTVQDANGGSEADAGAFKIVISKPGEENRPRTMEDLDPNATPVLDIAIPSWRIGTPHFTGRGTPLIRGSSYAPTEDFRRSVSVLNRSHRDMSSARLPLGSRKPSALNLPQVQSSWQRPMPSPALSTPRALRPMRSTYMSIHLVIEPAMFDDLTFKPDCDDRSIVRYSTTGAVTAATPPRLVAEITSPTFLDYELISDFFLTFRAFLEPGDLLKMLVARLRWAVARDDQTGMVVRVRTFVALRHWILNYFLDDFVTDYRLRVDFCNLLNAFVDDLANDNNGRKVQVKILTELKKCWRRVCAHYWDGAEFDDTLSANVSIAPGGKAGRRASTEDLKMETEDTGPPQLDSFLPIQKPEPGPTSFYVDVSRAGHVGDSIVPQNRPTTPEHEINAQPDLDFGHTSPLSMTSMDVISCSFPSKAIRNLQMQHSHPLAAHPVSSSSVYNHTGPVATTPKALVGKRVRPSSKHRRENSLTDSLRERDPDNASAENKEFLMSTPHAGSLVRGNLLPPTKGFVDISPHTYHGINQRQTTVFQQQPKSLVRDRTPPDAMSSYGMRKLIGSVRRVLSTRGQPFYPSRENLTNLPPIGPAGATTNRIPGTAVVALERQIKTGIRPPVRVDLLGAEVAEDFKKAIREDAAADAEKYGQPRQPPKPEPATADVEYSAAHMESSTFDTLPQNKRLRPVSDMGITGGSRSVVIVDDTVPLDVSSLHGGPAGTINSSVEDFADKILPQGADPTPPNTPPARGEGGVPRRSSYLLNQQIAQPSVIHDPLPPFVPDLATLGGDSCRPSEDLPRPSLSMTQSSRRPPVSSGVVRIHKRNRSNRTQQSIDSLMLRRRASYNSGFVPPSTVQSFDATTFSGQSMRDRDSTVPIPKPLQVLRRRPGGDLRAATNVGELDRVALRRSRSLGSLTTYSDSLRSSFVMGSYQESFNHPESIVDNTPVERQQAFSVGQLAKKGPKRDLSLFSTHSSKPIMRPSFEAEAQKLAQIPDDDDDDGGIESALMKLEGNYKKPTPRLSMNSPRKTPVEKEPVDPEAIGVAISDPLTAQQDQFNHRHVHVEEKQVAPRSSVHRGQVASEMSDSFLEVPDRPGTGLRSFLSEESHESYSSIPILQRDLVDDLRGERITGEWADRSILRDSDDDASQAESAASRAMLGAKDPHHMSFDFIHKPDDLEDAKSGTILTENEEQSFLDDESVDGTDLSSELSVEGTDFRPVEEGGPFSSMPKLLTHPLGEPSPRLPKRLHSPSTPRARAVPASPESGNIPQLHEEQLWTKDGFPITPQTTPPAPYVHAISSPPGRVGMAEALHDGPDYEEVADPKYSAHLPFILAFESDVLAQQFTLIEKDALNEIDWKELVDMNWKNSECSQYRSWVHFLRNADARGVEVVIARFNIMVKWAISEIILTKDIEERARCVIKYIHIASHCRRYRNFATLAQLTIALTSSEIARLTRTWRLVPAQDIKVLKELESLVTPTRNFFNLRAEMETGTEAGCIPFVVIYTHDLLYNAQRPSEIASSPTTAPLVNFERCRVGAAVVKTLLRLLEASSRYDFQPIEGITERCLWMGALSDEEIRRHSEHLE